MPDPVASEALAACPFCGTAVGVSGGGSAYESDHEYWIYCSGCGARHGYCGTRALVVKLWNRRTPAAPAVGDPREIAGAHVSTCDPLVMRDNQLLKEQVARLEADLALLRQAGRFPADGEEECVAWCCYKQHPYWMSIRTCDSDTPGAFKVYRHPESQARGVVACGTPVDDQTYKCIQTAIGFFVSSIKCGEDWTSTSETVYQNALSALAAMRRVTEGAG